MIHTNHYIVMFVIMIFSGLLSTMNIWVDKSDDIRFSINDIYMIFLMTGWMFLFMGLFYRETYITVFGIILVIINIFFIRNQYFVTPIQYIQGMIPHHSMAVLMSKKLLENYNIKNKEFIINIIRTQEKEIEFMKKIKYL